MYDNTTCVWGVLVAGRAHKRAKSDFAQVQIPELEILSLHTAPANIRDMK